MLNQKNLNIKDWAEEDRPREKLKNKGIGALTDAEMIAILIGSGTKNESAVDVSKRLMNTADNNLNVLGKKTLRDLMQVNGIGEAKAISIMASLELGKRRKLADILTKQKITSSKEVYELFSAMLMDLPHEEFWVIMLNRSNTIIEKYKLSQGGIAGTVIDVKIIIKKALENLASSLILCHNHPSGNIRPSQNDRVITNKLSDAAKYFDIKVLDHLIVSDNGYYSFADEGDL